MAEKEVRVAVVGGSGYAGGEILRLLLPHPEVRITQVTSESNRGKYVHQIHPNLRGQTGLRFCSAEDLRECDVLFSALPHGTFAERVADFSSMSTHLIDLSSDFRLKRDDLMQKFYNRSVRTAWAEHFTYGVSELYRTDIRNTRHIAGAGCLATASILGLYPLARAGYLSNTPIVIEAKVGSSAAGASPNLSTHHPERSGAMRSFQPTGHRHTAEIAEHLSAVSPHDICTTDIHFSATAVERIRGILITAHCFTENCPEKQDLWKMYRQTYAGEPFVRIVKERTGIYRYPDPKLLDGTNFCEVGFELDAETGRVVVMSALDNLVKGAAGGAVQAMNVLLDYEETTGLEFAGLHP